MKRSELEALGLSKEQMDAVMKAYGADIEAAKAETAGLKSQVADLTGQIGKRDADLKDLRTQLEAAQTDATRLADVTKQLGDLRTQYDADTAAYQKRLKDQAFDHALDRATGSITFSSKAARAQFLTDVRAKGLSMEGEQILGFDDYVKTYRESDPGAFAPEAPDPQPGPAPGNIVAPKSTQPEATASPFQFHFTPVRKTVE